jgi:hypothetical protein
VHYDFDAHIHEGVVTKEFPAKLCTQEDFGDDEHADRLYQRWVDYLKLCPSIHEDSQMLLLGNSGEKESTSL